MPRKSKPIKKLEKENGLKILILTLDSARPRLFCFMIYQLGIFLLYRMKSLN